MVMVAEEAEGGISSSLESSFIADNNELNNPWSKTDKGAFTLVFKPYTVCSSAPSPLKNPSFGVRVCFYMIYPSMKEFFEILKIR